MLSNFRLPALLLFFTLAAAAQSPVHDWASVKGLAAGTSVRVSIGSRTVSGQLQNSTDDSLGVNSGKGPETFARQDVTRVAVKKQSHRGRNTLIGLGAGAGLGAVVGAASYSPCTGLCILHTTRAEDAGAGAAALGLVGAVIGALIPTGGWHEIYK